MIHLALIRQRYAADGGAERFVARTLEALKGQEVRVTLITRAWQRVEGTDVIVLNPFYIGRLWRDWSFARAVRRLLATRRFDLVQSHERIPGCDIYRAGDGVHREWLMQRARALPWWGKLLQALNPYHAYVKCAERQTFTSPRLRAVICNSKMVRDEIKRHFGVADEKLAVIYNGVNLADYHPDLRRHRGDIRARYGIADAATLLLFVGSGFERKGVPMLLAAMRELPPSIFLLIVGRDKKSARYQRRAARLGLGGRVIFAGSQPDVKPYYGAADALVLPTLYDPFPNVAIEAMAAGLAVITSFKSGAAEFLRPNVDGFICDALDRDCLTAAMRRVAAGFAAHGNNNPRARVESLTLENMGAQLCRLYAGLVTPGTDA